MGKARAKSFWHHASHLLLVLLIVTFFTSMLVRMVPGEPAYEILGDTATKEQVKSFNKEFGLDRPVLENYLSWLGDVVQGDFGRSMRTNESVIDVVADRVPVTLEIGLLALLMALIVAIPLGIYLGYRANGAVDKASGVATAVVIATPGFVLGLMIAYFFAIQLDLFPATGWVPFSEDPVENLRRAFLPALALAVGEMAVYSRLLRADMVATLKEDYILSARAQGLPTRTILFRYALRPSSFTLVTLTGLAIGRVLGGTILIEQIFGLPGVGQLLYTSIISKDTAMVSGLVLIVAFVYVFVNRGVDVFYRRLDPRVKAVAA